MTGLYSYCQCFQFPLFAVEHCKTLDITLISKRHFSTAGSDQQAFASLVKIAWRGVVFHTTFFHIAWNRSTRICCHVVSHLQGQLIIARNTWIQFKVFQSKNNQQTLHKVDKYRRGTAPRLPKHCETILGTSQSRYTSASSTL